MRRNRRGHSSGMEFGESGADSFVAVVVTKLTGALLFILLLTMVIMALLPKVVDLPSSPGEKGTAEADKTSLSITTPEDLPEAIAGRAYHLAFAADGGRGHLHWSMVGTLPDGLNFDGETGLLLGTPTKGTPEPVALAVTVSDGSSRATRAAKLVIYQPETSLSTPSKWKPALPPIPWREWLNQGVGFLILWLVHLLGINTINALRYRALDDALDGEDSRAVARRFLVYKVTLSVMSLAATATLAVWLWWPR
jgi:hypothetical protein